jgi:MFS family permease
MSSLHTDDRRISSEQQQQQQQQRRDDLDETPCLLLSRTRSQEFSVAESIAVQEVPPEASKPVPDDDEVNPASTTWPRSVKYLVFLCAFLTSLSFGVTQVPLLYVFRLMTCDAYYEDHPSQVPNPIAQSLPAGTKGLILSYALAPVVYSTGTKIESDSDRCSIHAIETSTALSVSLLGASTTVFGLLNLFLTGSLIKRIGVKPTLLIQVFFPALRLLVQNVGVEVWGNAGIIIIQCSQIVSIFGGPSGYLLVLNTFITEVVEYEGRTAALGRLTGSMMFGSALGFLLGGVVAEAFGIKAPFRLTCMLFLSACAYVVFFLPHIPPAEAKVVDTGSISGKKKRRIFTNLFSPLAVFAPQKFIGRDGVVQTEYGAFLLAWGVFLGILATGEFLLS